MRLLKVAHKFIKDHGATILAVIGSIGVVGVAYCSAQDTKKADEHIRQATEEKGEELTVLEKADVSVMDYIPTACTTVATIACILGSDHLNRKKQAMMMSAYAMLSQAHTTYRNKVRELDEDIDKQAMTEVVRVRKQFTPDAASDKNLFFEEHYGDYFEASLADVRHAEYVVNKLLNKNGYVSLADFFRELDIPTEPRLSAIGWDYDDCVDWVEFMHNYVTIDDDLECCCIECDTPVTYI